VKCDFESDASGDLLSTTRGWDKMPGARCGLRGRSEWLVALDGLRGLHRTVARHREHQTNESVTVRAVGIGNVGRGGENRSDELGGRVRWRG
jgi:hypothetical protein